MKSVNFLKILKLSLSNTYFQFDQPTLLLDGRDVYLDENSDVFTAYVKYATELAVAVGADEKSAAEQMKNVVDFETELAKVWRNLG